MESNSLGTIIISDIHFNRTFDPVKLDFITKLLNRCDQVILNGDLWSHYLQPFDEFVNGPYKVLFPLLLEKKCIYLYGNHDKEEWCDERTKLFSIFTGNEYEFKDGDVDLYITHGHMISHDSVTNEKFIEMNRSYYEFNRLNKSYKLYPYFMRMLYKLRNTKLFERLFTRVNDDYRVFTSKLPSNKTLVVGHTHVYENDIENRFINTGYINYGKATFISVKNGEITHFKGTYESVLKDIESF